MKIVYLGSGEFGINCLKSLLKSGHNLDLILTQPPHPAGRGRALRPTPVADWAKNHSLTIIETQDVNSPEIIEEIASLQPELVVVIAFGQKVGNQLIALPEKGTINVHASLLPKYRGAAPINWAIVNGESETGISIISLVEEIDAGPVLAQAKTNIAVDETAGLLHDRLAEMAAPLLLETVDKIADGSIMYNEQDSSKLSRAGKLKKTDGFLDFSESAESLRRKILGFWPWPGASAYYISVKSTKRHHVTIAGAETVEISKPANLKPGTIDEDMNVICGRGALKITRIKPAGGRLMDFEDFVNGRQTLPGDLFAKIEK